MDDYFSRLKTEIVRNFFDRHVTISANRSIDELMLLKNEGILCTGKTIMTLAIIAEKPSVARDIALALGATRKGDGFMYGRGYTISWAIGHLVALAEPHEIDPAWKTWRPESLPMLPSSWPLKVLEETRAQYRVVERILKDSEVERIVCATDAGREGELIFRYIYEKAGCKKKVMRLWISSLTKSAIERGMANLKRSEDFDNLAAAARGRSQADWLVGMNLSRAYTLSKGEMLSVGRVQTPTLAMIVGRTAEIRSFVPEDYLEVQATFALPNGSYVGVYINDKNETRLPFDGEAATAIETRARTGKAIVERVAKDIRRQPPPLLYDLTELQRHANRLYGFTAKKTLKVAQSLYETHKLISYPRTDSRHLSRDAAAGLGEIVDAIRGPYEGKLATGTGERPLGLRFVDDDRVTDHHAIIPTTSSADSLATGGDERKIYDLICRRLLMAWHGPLVTSVTSVITRVGNPGSYDGSGETMDRYRSSGTLVVEEGWKSLDLSTRTRRTGNDEGRCDDQAFPAGLSEGDEPIVSGASIRQKRTEPPKPFTDATLLTAMETAGKTLDDKALSEAMKENGLGTPATRAAVIETLIDREYITREGKSLFATDKGRRLIDGVHEHVKSPAMTGLWERRLKDMERGRERLDIFMKDIESYVSQVVGEVLSGRDTQRPVPVPETSTRNEEVPLDPRRQSKEKSAGRPPSSSSQAGPRERVRLESGEPLASLLRRVFGFDGFRPHQEEVCQALVAGRDVLVVMPTGAGKSLCYQIPGLARGGTTLVISPLIALMEDQTFALRKFGLRAERIHSGMSREAAREVCRLYLRGDLDYLFVAPERLGVPGFPEMLAKRMPALTAVDEAHCISQWGHDFRPDYRMLKERLSLLRAAPVIAMTATATPIVQDDIVRQLDMRDAVRSIHGFRRTNIAVEVVEMPERERSNAISRLLSDRSRRPAIVYAPTRKKAEALAESLSSGFSVAAYHAGMSAQSRERVQTGFLKGDLEVIVATIAFGMGIDKPDVRTVVHAALPGSIEGYYQEIGRAGRDGLPSRAVLMFAYADVKTHEFFLDRDYPEPDVLGKVFERLTSTGQTKEALLKSSGMDDDSLATAIEKLWIHGGADVSPDETVFRGKKEWRRPYMEQRRHKEKELELMVAFARSMECRMLRLVRHFGDQEDLGEPCGQCDVCRPGGAAMRRTRAATDAEHRLMRELLMEIELSPSLAKGKLFRDRFEGRLSRNEFESLVEALFRAGFIRVESDAFTREGKTVEFQRLAMTKEGYRALRERGAIEAGARVTEKEISPARKPKRHAMKDGSKKRRANPPTGSSKSPASSEIAAELKAWRLNLARKRGIPAFRILTDRVLVGIADAAPGTEEELLLVSGVGDSIVKKYGSHILSICRRLSRQ